MARTAIPITALAANGGVNTGAQADGDTGAVWAFHLPTA